MCGFVGIFGADWGGETGEKALDALAHRGPDDRGVFREEDVFLGHVRLRVIDPEGGRQPMTDESGRYVIAYNGEIYNFRELREDLSALGYRFRTRSDTEVLLSLFIAFGPEMLHRLNGIYAFAVWDRTEKRLFASRDPFGVKPLHYWQSGKVLALASEFKAFLGLPGFSPELSFRSLHYYMNLRFIPGDETLLKHVRRLGPGATLRYHDGATQVLGPEPPPPQAPAKGSYADHVDAVRSLLKQAVRRQLVSDVPIGVSLSGGMDSATLVAMMAEAGAEINAFTVAFGEPTDETEDARYVAEHFGARHFSVQMAPEPLRDLPLVTWHVEEPKVNALQGYLLSGFVREHLPVLLGGLGGDELFGGYVQNRFLYWGDLSRRLIKALGLARQSDRLAHWVYAATEGRLPLSWDEPRRGLQMALESGEPEVFYGILRNVWDHDRSMLGRIYQSGPLPQMEAVPETASLFRPYFDRDASLIEGGLRADFHLKMISDFLVNEDRTSMAHGIESRVPLLDRDLVDYCLRIPVRHRLPGGRLKRLMKDAMAPYLPQRILKKRKWGFAVNPYHQYRKDLRTVAERMLTPERLRRRGIFRFERVREVLLARPHPRLRWHYFYLWLLIGLEVWTQIFLEGKIPGKGSRIEDYYE